MIVLQLVLRLYVVYTMMKRKIKNLVVVVVKIIAGCMVWGIETRADYERRTRTRIGPRIFITDSKYLVCWYGKTVQQYSTAVLIGTTYS